MPTNVLEAGNFDKSTRDPLSVQLANINIDQRNITNIFEAIQNAIIGENTYASAEVTLSDGTKTTISIPGSSFIFREIQRVSKNMETLLGLEGGGTTIIDSEGNARNIKLSTLLRCMPGDLEKISKNQYASIDITSAIFDLMYPMPKIDFTLPKEFQCSNVLVKKVRFVDLNSINLFNEGIEYQELVGKLKTENIEYTETEDNYNITIQSDLYYGSFNILLVERNANGSINITLDKLTYSDVRSIQDGIELVIGDLLSDKYGNGVYRIDSIDRIQQKVTVNLIAGFDKLEAGIKTLWYQYNKENVRTVAVPIAGNERSFVFLSPINPETQTASGISKGFVIDTSKLYIVNSGTTSIDFDSWFNNSVINIGNYLKSIAEDTSIPLSLGIKPNTPILDSSSFQVVQINKHITDTSDVERIKALANEKEQTFSKINTLTKRISAVNKRINIGRYRSVSDKNNDLDLLTKLNNEKEQLTSAYESLVQDIDSKTKALTNTESYSPKYRIRGFWQIQEPIKCSSTRDQQIIHYEVEYRYLNSRENVSNASSIKFKDSEQYRTGVISSWNRLQTSILKRVIVDGKHQWETNKPEDSDSISINQCDIPISLNESVEIRVKACSEAGYPQTMLESDWSDILRIDFPAELTREASLQQTIEDNKEDQKKVQVEQLLREKGLLEHTSTSYTEQERYFAHTSQSIASGFYTNEQKTIPLFDKLNEMSKQLEQVYNKIFSKTPEVTVDIVDENGVSYPIIKNSTISLFAGYYQDTVDMTNAANYGTIVQKKFYIRLQNLTSDVIQIFSKFPGKLSEKITEENVKGGEEYTGIPLKIGAYTIGETQYLSQFLYLKNHDIFGESLYTKQSKTTTKPDGNLVTQGVEVNDREIAFLDSTDKNVLYGKFLADDTDVNYGKIIGIHHSYPDFNREDEIKRILKRIQYTDKNAITDYVLPLMTTNLETPNCMSYQSVDKYIVGTYSCGARLYLNPPTRNFIQVNGVNENAYTELQTGDSNAILIPVIFEYRMSDRIGNPGIETSENFANNFIYRKKISLELYLNRKPLVFDLEIYSQYKNEDLTVSDVNYSTRKNVIDSIDHMDSVVPNIE